MVLFFIIFPFLAFLMSLRDLNKRGNALVFILFCGLFGYCQHFQLETADSFRIGLRFEDGNLWRDIIQDYYVEGQMPDLYIHLTRYLIRPFTANPKVYFGILGLIFGVLCYNFYKFVYRNWTGPKQGLFFALILLVMTSVSLMDFVGVRTATATMLFLGSAYKYIYCNKKIWIIGVLLSPLVHFYMWSVVILFLLYILTPMIVTKFSAFFKIALVVAFSLSLIDVSGKFSEFFEENEDDVVNESIATKAENYTSGAEGSAINLRDNSLYSRGNWLFFTTYRYINRFGLLILMWFLINYAQKRMFDKPERRMYLFLLVISIPIILSFSINPILGERIIKNWWMMFFVLFARLYSLDSAIPAKRLIGLMLFFNFNYILWVFYNIPRVVELSFWVYPVPFSIIKGLNFSIG